MPKICLAFRKSEPQYAYKRYAYKEHVLSNAIHGLAFAYNLIFWQNFLK